MAYCCSLFSALRFTDLRVASLNHRSSSGLSSFPPDMDQLTPKPNRCSQAPNAPGDRIPVTRISQSGSPVTSCTNDSSHGRNALILSLNSSSPGEKILSVRIENEKRIDDALFGNIHPE